MTSYTYNNCHRFLPGQLGLARFGGQSDYASLAQILAVSLLLESLVDFLYLILFPPFQLYDLFKYY